MFSRTLIIAGAFFVTLRCRRRYLDVIQVAAVVLAARMGVDQSVWSPVGGCSTLASDARRHCPSTTARRRGGLLALDDPLRGQDQILPAATLSSPSAAPACDDHFAFAFAQTRDSAPAGPSSSVNSRINMQGQQQRRDSCREHDIPRQHC